MTAALQDSIERETALVQAFIEAAEAETAALLDRRAHDTLQAAARRKEELAMQLEQQGAQRDALLTQEGLAAGHAGMQQAIERFPGLAQAWQRLQQHADIARDRNTRNGTLIAAHLRQTRESLEALHHIMQQNGASTYDASGRGARPGSSGRAIVAA